MGPSLPDLILHQGALNAQQQPWVSAATLWTSFSGHRAVVAALKTWVSMWLGRKRPQDLHTDTNAVTMRCPATVDQLPPPLPAICHSLRQDSVILMNQLNI